LSPETRAWQKTSDMLVIFVFFAMQSYQSFTSLRVVQNC
jgi:hypothetical protein